METKNVIIFYVKLLIKLFKIIFALILLPFCIGAVVTLWKVILISGKAEIIWSTTLAGAFVWILIYIFLPEPKWMYVLGHELTHALWSTFFGGKLKRIKVNSDGGHVLTTKSNFLISLAPYFFPLYVVLIVIIFLFGNFLWNWNNYVLWFYFLIGMMYAFHITLTYNILKIKQPDIVGEGYIFSTVIIFFGNVCVLLIGIPLLANKISVGATFNLWLNNSTQIYHYLGVLLLKR